MDVIEEPNLSTQPDDLNAPAPAAEPAVPTPAGPTPAVFTPAVFIPAHPPHPATGADPLAAGEAHARQATSDTLRAPDRRQWSDTLSRVGEELVAWLKTVVSAAVYATLIVTFGFQVARVEGSSMIPTLHDQDRLIVNKWTYRWHDPQPGDVVMLYYPEEPDKSFVKRVMAKEGDTIRSEYGHVFVNEIPISDDFIPEEYKSDDSWGPYVVKKGYYFVMGDHRNNSSDSRIWGEVPKKYIIGRVQIRWWPIDGARIF